MDIPYLKGLPWSRWTRDERYFCSVLYTLAAPDPADFAAWLIDSAGLGVKKSGNWDLGYEVVFYRDYLWQLGSSASNMGFSKKRTFDLCLFGTQSLIVIEAKVSECFDTKQIGNLVCDRKRIPCLQGLKGVAVQIVALASSKYFTNQKRYGRKETLKVFDGCVSWASAEKKYGDPLLRQADDMYKLKPWEIFDDRSA